MNGGNCVDASLPCHKGSAPQRYANPDALTAQLAAFSGNEWFVLQAYRFVTGASAGRWDCTASDWTAHWTESAEEYCWTDCQHILAAMPATAKVVSPEQVATAWGRHV